MSIGKVIQQLRTNRELSQAQLAESIGIRQASLSDIERGKSTPSRRTLNKISRFFDVSVDYIRIAAIDVEKIPVEQRGDFKLLFGDLLSNLEKIKQNK